MATGTKINNIPIPSPMDERGSIYHFEPGAIVAQNGQGQDIAAPYARLTWQWPYLTLAEYTYWYTTILGGAPSARFTANNLLINNLQVLTAYKCTVRRPTYETIQAGNYINVVLIIDQIEP